MVVVVICVVSRVGWRWEKRRDGLTEERAAGLLSVTPRLCREDKTKKICLIQSEPKAMTTLNTSTYTAVTNGQRSITTPPSTEMLTIMKGRKLVQMNWGSDIMLPTMSYYRESSFVGRSYNFGKNMTP